MSVTKQTYTATATWTPAQLAGLFRSAFIDAGLMTDWHDSTSNAWFPAIRVIKLEYDNTKTYGATYVIFFFGTDWTGYAIASNWNTSTKTQAGTQFLDYHVPIASSNNVSVNAHGSRFELNTVFGTDIFLDRYTSNTDTKQSWFLLRQGTNRARPFSLLHPQSILYPWLNLNMGIIDPYLEVVPEVSVNLGGVRFREQENIQRCLTKGHALTGTTTTNGSGSFHSINCKTYNYVAVGSAPNMADNNMSSWRSQNNGAIPLPVGVASSNPAYSTDFVPVCSQLPWSRFTSTPLAADFGIHMHYAANTIGMQDKFVVTPNVEEWEVLDFTNNATIINGASSTFLARIV